MSSSVKLPPPKPLNATEKSMGRRRRLRFNPPLKIKYDALRAAGKPAKLALTAIMRRIITTANALLRDNRKWTETMA